MIVYPDLAFLLGLQISASLFILTLKMIGLRKARWETVTVIGLSGVSFAFGILPAGWWIGSLAIFFASAVFFFRGKTFQGTLKNIFRFGIISLSYLGVFLLFSLLFQPMFLLSERGGYFLLSFFKTSLSAFFAFGILFLFVCFYKKRFSKVCHADCIAVIRGKTVPFCAYIDTGNFLKDPISGLPVVILEYKYLLKYFKTLPPPGSYAFLSLFSQNARVVPVRSVSGEGAMLSGFVPDAFSVDGQDYRVVIVLSERPLESMGQFSGLIGPDFIGGTV